MNTLARPLLAVLIMIPGILGSAAVSAPAPAGPEASGSGDPSAVYGGPTALYDPDDPLQGTRWTLGLTLPRRSLLTLGRSPAARTLEYDLSRGRILLSYKSGTQEILPSTSYTGQEYAVYAFRHQLRQTWKASADQEMFQGGQGRGQGGLVDVSLPFELPFTEKLFGPGAPNLRVSGNESITISGNSSWVVGRVTGERGGGSLFPKLDMRQRLNVNLQGTIGTKLFIDVAQNSDALTPLENAIKIRYKGEEDDVLQAVELGNTNLSLPPTQFISYSTRQEGLFGAKAVAQIGNIDITAIASRKEGESGKATFTGGSQERTVRIDDTNFVNGKFFFLTDPDSLPVPSQVLEVRLYLDDASPFNDQELGAQPADVWLDPDLRTPADSVRGTFHLLDEGEDGDYVLYNSQDYQSSSIPQIVLRNRLLPTHTLAVAYSYVQNGVIDTVGTFQAPGDTTLLQLKMMRPSTKQWATPDNDLRHSPWAAVRRLEMKNVYDLQVRNIESSSFELTIVRDIAGENGNNPLTLENEFGASTQLLEVLGLDQKNNLDPSSRIPDGLVDPEYVDLEHGYLYFPDLRPFDPSLTDIEGSPVPGGRARSWPRDPAYSRPDTLGWEVDPVTGLAVPSPEAWRNQETVPEIYDLLPTYLSSVSQEHHLYTIEVKTQSASKSTIQLDTFGSEVLSGSETVRLNGQVLERGKDYNIFYETGLLQINHPDATSPGANLVVTYDYDSPFSTGSQSLLGTSISTRDDPASKFLFSTSWLHEVNGNPDRRPRLGGEPTRTTVGDVSGRVRLQPWLLTDIVDRLPLVRTNAPSRLEVQGAVGVSMPNPNTRDEVYIDDMEGSEVVVPASIARGAWFYSSVPEEAINYLDGGSEVFFKPKPADRGQLLWFSPTTVQVKDLTPREDNQQTRDDLVPVLEVVYVPQTDAGVYDSWGGLVTPLRVGGTIDVSTSQFLEVWVNDFVNDREKVNRRGELLIDVGTVNEDAVWDPLTPPAEPNQQLDVEDKNRSGNQIEYDEDTGLDGVRNDGEPAPAPNTIRWGPKPAEQDPAGDDRLPDVETHLPDGRLIDRIRKYRGINGTEGNQRADGEDLDGDFSLDQENNYYEYRIDLSDPAFLDVGRDLGVTDSKNGWRLYRIPLDGYHMEVGTANLSQVEHMRMWFRGVDPGDTLDVQIASIEIVGNRWELAQGLNRAPDESFKMFVVNNKEDAGYTEPFEVERINNVKEREQSVALTFENLRPGSEHWAFSRQAKVRDYTLYRDLAFYLNPRFEMIPQDSVEFFLRFGSTASTDTLSYYEISTVLTQNDPRRRGDGWINLRLPITELSRLKIDYGAVLPDSFIVGPGDGSDGNPARADLGNGLKATIRGSPSFSRIWRISVGVRNVSGQILSEGAVWFDELRMGEVRKDRGYATQGSINMQLADLATLGGSVSMTSADFLLLGQNRGSGTENLRYDLHGQIGLHKFMEPLHLQAPLTGSFRKSRQTPKFRPNSDILFDGSDSGRDISESVQRNLSLALSRTTRNHQNWLAFYTIDALTVNGSMSQNFQDRVTRADTTYQKNGSVNYRFDAAHWRPLHLLKFDLYPWPRSITANLNGSRQERREWTPGTDNVLRLTKETVTKSGNLGLSAGVQPIQSLNYTWSSNRDLIDEHFGPDSSVVRRDRPEDRFLGVNIGRETRQTHSLAFTYTPPFLGRTLQPRFTWNSGSTQNKTPSLTLENYTKAAFSVENNNTANISMSLPLGDWMNSLTGAGRRDPRRPGPRRPALPDTTQKKGKGQLAKFFTEVIALKPVQGSGQLTRTSSYTNLSGSPPMLYRLGLSRDVGLGTNVETIPNASFNPYDSRTVTLRGNSSVVLFREITLDFNYQRRTGKSQIGSAEPKRDTEVTWPDIRFNWGDFQDKLPFVGKLLKDFKVVNTQYTRQTKDTGRGDNPRETRTVTTSWRPLLSLQGTLAGWRSNLSLNRTSSENVSNRPGGGSVVGRSNTTSFTVGVNRRLKRVDLKIDLSYNANSQEVESSSQVLKGDSRQAVRLNTSAGVRLSSKMTGTFGLELGQEHQKQADYTRRNIRVYFSTGFSF